MRTSKISRKNLARFSFLFFTCLDFISYKFKFLFSHGFYAGMIAIATGFLLLLSIFWLKGKKLIDSLKIMALFLTPILLAAKTEKLNFIEIYFWLKALSFYAIGFFFAESLLSRNNKSNVLALFTFIICIILLFIFPESTDQNYLRYSDGFVLMSFYLISFSQSKEMKLLLFFISIIALYLIGGRFVLFSFILIYLIFFVYTKNIAYKILFTIFMLLLFATLYAYLNMYFLTLRNIHTNRVLRLIYATQLDTSLSGRIFVFNNAIDVFKRNLIFGNYKYYYDYGSKGGYAHNFMSFWSELGIIGILMSFVITVNCLRLFQYLKYHKHNLTGIFEFSTYLSSVVLLGLIAAKSYNWSIYYFAIGFLYIVNNHEKLYDEKNNISPFATT